MKICLLLNHETTLKTQTKQNVFTEVQLMIIKNNNKGNSTGQC